MFWGRGVFGKRWVAGSFSPNPHILISCNANGAGCCKCRENVLRRASATERPGAAALRTRPAVEPREHLWAWRLGRNTSGAVGWGAPGRAGGTAAGVDSVAGPTQSASLCLEASELARNPSGCRSAGAQRDECQHLVPIPFLGSWSKLSSDLVIGPVRPRTGVGVLVPQELDWEVSQTGSVVIAHLRPQGLCLTWKSWGWSPCAHPSWCTWLQRSGGGGTSFVPLKSRRLRRRACGHLEPRCLFPRPPSSCPLLLVSWSSLREGTDEERSWGEMVQRNDRE